MDILRRNTDYALRLAVHLAKRYDDGSPLSTRTLATDEDVSYQLACKLMQKLHAAGLVESNMGPKGGFQLSKAPEHVPVREVIEAIQGPLRLNRCLLGDGRCDRQDACPIREKMGDLQDQMDAYLTSVTLGELAKLAKRPKKVPKRRKRRRSR